MVAPIIFFPNSTDTKEEKGRVYCHKGNEWACQPPRRWWRALAFLLTFDVDLHTLGHGQSFVIVGLTAEDRRLGQTWGGRTLVRFEAEKEVVLCQKTVIWPPFSSWCIASSLKCKINLKICIKIFYM